MTYFGGFPHPQGSEGVAHRRLDQILHILSSSGLCKGGAGLSERVCPAPPSLTSACGFRRPLTRSQQEETRSYKVFTEKFPNRKCLCEYEKRISKSMHSEGARAGQEGCSAAATPRLQLPGLFLQSPEVKGAGHRLRFFKLQKEFETVA